MCNRCNSGLRVAGTFRAAHQGQCEPRSGAHQLRPQRQRPLLLPQPPKGGWSIAPHCPPMPVALSLCRCRPLYVQPVKQVHVNSQAGRCRSGYAVCVPELSLTKQLGLCTRFRHNNLFSDIQKSCASRLCTSVHMKCPWETTSTHEGAAAERKGHRVTRMPHC
jgi:hypothetical protein